MKGRIQIITIMARGGDLPIKAKVYNYHSQVWHSDHTHYKIIIRAAKSNIIIATIHIHAFIYTQSPMQMVTVEELKEVQLLLKTSLAACFIHGIVFNVTFRSI